MSIQFCMSMYLKQIMQDELCPESKLTVYSETCLRQPPVHGPVLVDLYREVDCNALVLFGPREAGCFREVAA